MNRINNITSKIKSYFLFFIGLRNYKISTIKISKNKKLYILGTAPSIKGIDLTKINGEDIFLCNKGYLLKKNGLDLKKVKYYIDIDSRLYFENKDEIEEKTKNIKYRFWGNYFYKEKFKNDFFLQSRGKLINKNYRNFSPKEGIYETDTVVFTALQIAEYLGYKEIYLLGVDFYLEDGEKYFYEANNNGRDKRNTFPIQRIISDFKNIYNNFEKKGIHIFIGNKKSLLAKIAKYKEF